MILFPLLSLFNSALFNIFPHWQQKQSSVWMLGIIPYWFLTCRCFLNKHCPTFSTFNISFPYIILLYRQCWLLHSFTIAVPLTSYNREKSCAWTKQLEGNSVFLLYYLTPACVKRVEWISTEWIWTNGWVLTEEAVKHLQYNFETTPFGQVLAFYIFSFPISFWDLARR